jgi:Zn ribbon nucleic-acid-binding protein
MVKNEYTVLGNYEKSDKKIEMQHNLCGFKYFVSPSNFLKGNRCPSCAGNIKKDTGLFKQEVYNVVKDEYIVLGEYINSKEKIKMKHNICNYEYMVTPSDFLSGHRCPNCYGNFIKSSEQFYKDVFRICGNEYTFYGDYINNATKMKVKHNVCGYEYETLPGNFLQGHGCPKCANKKNGDLRKRSDEEFRLIVLKLSEEEYEVLSEYIDSQTNILMKHNKCGNIYQVKPNNFLQGQRCPKCQHRSYKKTTEEFKQEVKNLVGNEYEVLEEYQKANKKILFKHNIEGCQHEFTMTPNSFLGGSRCPLCKESKHEKYIYNWLKTHQYYFIHQFTFDDCKDKEVLPFDFAVFWDEEKTNLRMLIEYDGEYHYLPINGIRALKYIQKHDKMKNDYCIKNDIQLIRIPYWEQDNIEQILERVLKNVNNQECVNQ